MRRIWITIVALLLAVMLSGCTLSTGLYVRNKYPFPISVHIPYTAYDGRPVDVDGGTVSTGQQQRMDISLPTLRSGESQDLVVKGPAGEIVQHVRFSAQQEQDAYHANRPAAVFVSVGAGRVTVGYGADTAAQAAQIKQKKIIALFVGGLMLALMTGALAVWRLRAGGGGRPASLA